MSPDRVYGIKQQVKQNKVTAMLRESTLRKRFTISVVKKDFRFGSVSLQDLLFFLKGEDLLLPHRPVFLGVI